MNKIPQIRSLIRGMVLICVLTLVGTITGTSEAAVPPWQPEPMPLFKLPFEVENTWTLSQGVHPKLDKKQGARSLSALDFAPGGYSGCSDMVAEDRWVVAASAGVLLADEAP